MKEYYGPRGQYLKEHKAYFTKARTKKEASFLIDVLQLKKSEAIIDFACGNGRHIIELQKRFYNVDGLDGSSHLLAVAKREAERQNMNITFYKQKLENIHLKRKYDKAYLFFSDFGILNASKTLTSISRTLKKGGLFLLDMDSIFRLLTKLQSAKNKRYYFDAEKMILKERDNKQLKVRYYTPTEIHSLLEESGFKVKIFYGGDDKSKLSIKSKRIVVVAMKT